MKTLHLVFQLVVLPTDTGYHMGVYLCLGQPIYEVTQDDAVAFSEYGSFDRILEGYEKLGKVFVFLGEGTHKIKKKAEQLACELALSSLDNDDD